MHYISSNIHKLMKEKNLSLSEMSRQTGVSKATLSKWFDSDRQPRIDMVEKIAKAYDIPVDTFYSLIDEGEMNRYIADAFKRLEPSFEVSAGQGRINDGYGEPMKAFDGQTAKVVGDSMYPVLLEGDIVRFIESTDVTPSDLALVRIDGEAVTVKHVEWTDDGMWVRAENKDVFEDKFFTVKEIATIPVQIVGKAVEIVSRKL